MKLRLIMLLALFACLPALAQRTGVQGVVVDAKSGLPVAGATIMLDAQGNTVTTGPNGDFLISDAAAGSDEIIVLGYGYKDLSRKVQIFGNAVENLGTIKLEPSDFNATDEESQSFSDVILSESELEDEEGNSQSVATLTGASDNPFYQAASYDFSLMRFRIRGYKNEYTRTSINGINFNEPMRGLFNFSMTGGLNQAFKSKSIGMGLEATSYDFGAVGGSNNILTFAKDYAPGFRGSVAYTNGNYRYRGMVTYSTGLMPNGWAMTVSAVGRYADEGVFPGTFYNSWGYFLALQKVFNSHHSIALTTFGAPTKRASNRAVTQEAYDLAGSNMYNANWGWSDGKKRNYKVVESFSPTVILNWLWTPKMGTSLNTGAAFQKSFYSSADLNRGNNLPDIKPDYYKYLPSYYTDPDVNAYYTDLWQNSEDMRQVDWDLAYRTNHLNNIEAAHLGQEKSAGYILEKRHSNIAMAMLNSTLNTRISDKVTLQGGIMGKYTRGSYYKTLKDLLGGTFWSDIDTYAERDFPGDANVAQNDLNNPNRKIYEGDRFGYDYDIHSLNANIWKQFVFNLPKWDISYSLKADYTVFWRHGHMLNGRAQNNSYGRGKKHEFITAAFKAGATYKLDGRNQFSAHIYYGTEAPLPNNAFVSPRIKDDVIANLQSEKIFSADLGYVMNYRLFKASVTAFYTDMRNGTERTAFYDDQYSSFMNYALTGVHKVHKGVEIGVSYKLSSSLTLSGAANIARYQYKNRPLGTRSIENGSIPDVTTEVYLKNYYVSGTPQEAYTIALNWAGPKMWFVEINGTWMNRSYIDLSPIRHEKMDDLYKQADNMQDLERMLQTITTQEKLNEAFVLGASIGHVIYLNRRASLNLNLSLDNILNNKNIQTSGFQQGRFDYKNYTTTRFPNKYYYAQGFKMFLNVGVRF